MINQEDRQHFDHIWIFCFWIPKNGGSPSHHEFQYYVMVQFCMFLQPHFGQCLLCPRYILGNKTLVCTFKPREEVPRQAGSRYSAGSTVRVLDVLATTSAAICQCHPKLFSGWREEISVGTSVNVCRLQHASTAECVRK